MKNPKSIEAPSAAPNSEEVGGRLHPLVRRFVTPPCDLCSSVSVVMIRAEEGCTCLANIYQRRCHHHLLRADNSLEKFKIVEDYTVDKIFSSPNVRGQPPPTGAPAGIH